MQRLILTISFLILGSLCLAAEPTEGVLLINKPKLWAGADVKSAAQTLTWTAGKRVKIISTKSLTPDGKSSLTWHEIDDGKRHGWLPDAYLAPPPQKIEAAALNKIGAEPVDRYHGIPPEYKPGDLVPVGPLFDKEIKCQMRKEAAEALAEMFAAARRDGVKLEVVSGYRSWVTQQGLYEHRVRESGMNQMTVAKPGHSEHQLGTAADLTDGNEKTLLQASFGETQAGGWLRAHAAEYGFAISFTKHNQEKTGCAPEPWHYRYWGKNLAAEKHREALGE